MVDTSYNPTYAPFPAWSTRQAPVPATTHNVPASIAASGQVQSSLIVTEGFSLISVGVTASQAGTLSVQRYLDAGGTVVQGSAISVALLAATAANLDVLDGKPFSSFKITITNSSGSVSALTNFAVLLQASEANLPNTGVLPKVIIADPTSGAGALVQAFHNADNQSLGGSVYGIMTGGVDQLINGSGNLDRKRGVSGDGMAVTGLAAEVPMVWNGTSYDRVTGSASRGLDVNVKNSVTLAAGASAIGSISNTSFAATQSGTWTVQPGNTANTTAWLVSSAANTNGGASTFFAAAQSNTVTAVKSSAGNVYGFSLKNTTAADAYIQMFDLATGSVTLGTTTPKLSFWIPASGSYDYAFNGESKLTFATAISIAVTTTATGSTAPATGLVANIFYK